jgi:hypothetical protein
MGILALAGLAALSSLLIAVASAAWLYQIVLFLIHSPKSSVVEVEPIAYLIVPLAWLSLATLAWIAMTASLDLWRMKSRGRRLTLVAMSFVSMLGALFFWVGMPSERNLARIGIATLLPGALSIVYLLLPRVRTHFHQ